MPQETNRTGITSQNDLVRSELIPDLVRSYQYEPTIMMEIAHVEPALLGNTPVRFPRYDKLTVPSSAVSETNDNTVVALSTSTGTATPAIKRFSLLVSDEIRAARGIPDGMIDAETIAETMNAVLEDVDVQALALATSATQTYGAVTDEPSMEWLDGAILQYGTYYWGRANVPHAAVLAPNQWLKFWNSVKGNAGSAMGNIAAAGTTSAASGRKMQYGQYTIYSTNSVANESSDRRNAVLTPIGRGRSGIGIAMKEVFGVEINRGHSGAAKAGTWFDVRSWMGYGVADANALLEVLSED